MTQASELSDIAEPRRGELLKLADVGRLAGSVAHDLRNHLGALRTNLEFVAELVAHEASRASRHGVDEAAEALEEGRTALDRALSLLGGIAQLAHSNDRGAAVVDVSLAEVLQRTEERVLQHHHGPERRFLRHVPQQIWVRACRPELEQALQHLLLEMAEGQAGDLYATATSDGSRAQLLLGAQGAGDSAPRPLALSLSRALLRGWGGEVEVARGPQGLRFSLSLPVAG